MAKKQEKCLTKKDVCRFLLGLLVLGIFIAMGTWGVCMPSGSASLTHTETLSMTSSALTPDMREFAANSIDIGIGIHMAAGILGWTAALMTAIFLITSIINHSEW
jgi:hypothetical protein